MSERLRIAILGTRGVPARYGGFETAVEEVGSRLAARGHEVTVYARNPGQTLTEYRGMHVVNIPAVRTKSTETLSHTALSATHASLRVRPDVALVMNAANTPFLPLLRAAGIPAAIHLDGLESRRAKWRGVGARYYRWAETAAVRRSDAVVADSQVIADSVEVETGRAVDFIPYGARVINAPTDRLRDIGLIRRDFHLIVARFEPENHVLEAVHGYLHSDETRPLVVVGDAPYSRWYVDRIRELASDPRIILLGGVFDQELLDQLYGNSRTYVHGHSVGGTNPSLLRAMGAGAPVLAFDVEFNREVTADRAFFWKDADDLTALFDQVADDDIDEPLAEFSTLGRRRIAETYQWETVADKYEDLLYRLADPRRVGELR